MSTQPEVLRLAEKLLSPAILYTHDRAQIAAQLRRLHDENELLHKRCQQAYEVGRQSAQDDMDTLLRQALDALQKYHGNFEYGELFTVQDEEECEKTIAAIKEHLGVQ